jgi:hypothetical protein
MVYIISPSASFEHAPMRLSQAVPFQYWYFVRSMVRVLITAW